MKIALLVAALSILGLAACGPMPWEDCVMGSSCTGSGPYECTCQYRYGGSFDCTYDEGEENCCFSGDNIACDQ